MARVFGASRARGRTTVVLPVGGWEGGASIGVQRYYVTVGDVEVLAVDACRQYVDLLHRLVEASKGERDK